MRGLPRVGIFAHEDPVRQVVDRLEALEPNWMFAMHGGTLTHQAIPRYTRALQERPFAYAGTLLRAGGRARAGRLAIYSSAGGPGVLEEDDARRAARDRAPQPTHRELECSKLLMRGQSNAEIAQTLVITDAAADTCS